MTFLTCLSECIHNEDLVREFNRLTGARLGQSNDRSLIDRAVDAACGVSGESDADLADFIGFVYTYIWLPLAFSPPVGAQDA